MRRFIALDIGKKRTGIALVDDSVKVATPISVISKETSSKEFIIELISIIEEWEPESIIFGLPIDLKGKESIAAIEVRKRADSIAKRVNSDRDSRNLSNLTIEFVDERLTTAQAERALKDAQMSADTRKKQRDALAAAVIAQTFVDTL